MKMNNYLRDLPFERLCYEAQLGKAIGHPEPISGGLLHRMYAITTTEGKYAVKVLNPQIMNRVGAMENYIKSERISNLVTNNIPALPAKMINGEFVIELYNQFFLVFDWIEGTVLKRKEINPLHCRKMGAILGGIYQTDFSGLDLNDHGMNEGKRIDWNFYLKEGHRKKDKWAELLNRTLDKLYDWDSRSNSAAKILSTTMVISHRDLEPKNVLWKENNPIIIDWESAGFINPMQDVIETALSWSEDEGEPLIKTNFFLLYMDIKVIAANFKRIGVWY